MSFSIVYGIAIFLSLQEVKFYLSVYLFTLELMGIEIKSLYSY
nr:MAG TPA: hypothetical protein [Caudoviricetes sp.]